MKKEKNKIIIKASDLNVRNELHFEVQRKTRMNIFRDRTIYSRKRKHKGKEEN